MGNVQTCFASAVPSLPCANGHVTYGARIQTQYTYDEGGDGLWYTGTVVSCTSDGCVSVKYDDGDRWTGKAIFCYLLPEGSPGLTLPQPYGVPSQGGHVAPPGGHPMSATPVVQAIPVHVGADAGEAGARGRPVVGRPV